MPALNIKPTHKSIKTYYAELKAYTKIGVEHEGAVRTAFQNLLQYYCRQVDLVLVCEKTRYTPEKKRIRIDGEVVDAFDLPHGHWEAKDTHDDLPTEARMRTTTTKISHMRGLMRGCAPRMPLLPMRTGGCEYQYPYEIEA